ncbi:MAG: hypothetical protein Q7V57_16480 [Actinomycetota bacterium]|nr:hypothetical protein [Actinomycetota bacterium]
MPVVAVTYGDDQLAVVRRLVQPSTADQRVTIDSTLAVVVPGGLLDEPTTLAATQVPSLPNRTIGPLQAATAYSIELGDTSSFDTELTLEFVLDTAGGTPQPGTAFVSYFDETAGEWVPVEAEIANGVATVQTNHLSLWGVWQLAKSYNVLAMESFTVEHPQTGATSTVVYGTTDTAQVDGSAASIEALARRAAQEVGIAYTNYHSSGFEVPPAYVILDPSTKKDEGGYDPTTGAIIMPTTYQDEDELASSITHEMFHAFQGAQVGTWRMDAARWLMEATAEYASKRIASVPAQPFDANAYRLDPAVGMRIVDGSHEYKLAEFIDHFLTASGLGFGEFWTQLADGSGNLDERFNTIVESTVGIGDDEYYRVFLHTALTTDAVTLYEPPDAVEWTTPDDAPDQSAATGRLTVPADSAMHAVTIAPPPSAADRATQATIEFTLASQPRGARVAVLARQASGSSTATATPLVDMAVDEGTPVHFTIPAGSGVLITLFGESAGVSGSFRVVTVPDAVTLAVNITRGGPALALQTHPAVAVPFVTGLAEDSSYEVVARFALDEGIYQVDWAWPCYESPPTLGRVNTITEPDLADQELTMSCTIRGEPGLNQIGVTITDNQAASSAPMADVQIGFHLTEFTPITSATVGTPTVFTAPDHHGSYLYRWQFGDGATADTDVPTATHTYTTPTTAGPAEVTLELLPTAGSGDLVLATFTSPPFEVTGNLDGTWSGTMTFTACSIPPGTVPSCDYYMSAGALELHLRIRTSPDGSGEVDIWSSSNGQSGPVTTEPITWTLTSVSFSRDLHFTGTVDLAAGTMTGAAWAAEGGESIELSWQVHRE